MFLIWAAACISIAPLSWSHAGERLAGAAAASTPENAAERLDYTPPSWPEAPETGALLLRLAAGTATVLVLCAFTLVVSRRWLRGPAPKTGASSELRVTESLPLGNRCYVHLLRAGRHQIVVGVDGSGMKSLLALPESFENSLTDAEKQQSVHPAEAAQQLVVIGV
jgi:flagellar biogenesis protein FliO